MKTKLLFDTIIFTVGWVVIGKFGEHVIGIEHPAYWMLWGIIAFVLSDKFTKWNRTKLDSLNKKEASNEQF